MLYLGTKLNEYLKLFAHTLACPDFSKPCMIFACIAMILVKQNLTSNKKKRLIAVIKFWSNFEFGSNLEFSGTAPGAMTVSPVPARCAADVVDVPGFACGSSSGGPKG